MSTFLCKPPAAFPRRRRNDLTTCTPNTLRIPHHRDLDSDTVSSKSRAKLSRHTSPIDRISRADNVNRGQELYPPCVRDNMWLETSQTSAGCEPKEPVWLPRSQALLPIRTSVPHAPPAKGLIIEARNSNPHPTMAVPPPYSLTSGDEDTISTTVHPSATGSCPYACSLSPTATCACSNSSQGNVLSWPACPLSPSEATSASSTSTWYSQFPPTNRRSGLGHGEADPTSSPVSFAYHSGFQPSPMDVPIVNPSQEHFYICGAPLKGPVTPTPNVFVTWNASIYVGQRFGDHRGSGAPDALKWGSSSCTPIRSLKSSRNGSHIEPFILPQAKMREASDTWANEKLPRISPIDGVFLDKPVAMQDPINSQNAKGDGKLTKMQMLRRCLADVFTFNRPPMIVIHNNNFFGTNML